MSDKAKATSKKNYGDDNGGLPLLAEMALQRAWLLRHEVEKAQLLGMLGVLYMAHEAGGDVRESFWAAVGAVLVAHGMLEGDYEPLSTLPFGGGL